ncbi:MAG: hypothetical protein OXB88_04175 [Bacteriovoracales bacterium]|nr:hypothetical protein [Bacteriovoracales bacterium]
MSRFIECVNCSWVGSEELIFKRHCINCEPIAPKRVSRERTKSAVKIDVAQIKMVQEKLQKQKESASWIK